MFSSQGSRGVSRRHAEATVRNDCIQSDEESSIGKKKQHDQRFTASLIIALAAVVRRKHRQSGGVEQINASHGCLASGRIRYDRRAGSKRIKKWLLTPMKWWHANATTLCAGYHGSRMQIPFPTYIFWHQHRMGRVSSANLRNQRHGVSIVGTCAGHGYGWNRRQVGGVEQMYQVSASAGKSSTAIVPDPSVRRPACKSIAQVSLTAIY